MGTNSKIEWTESTWNPVVGCSKVSVGCDNCYAERMANRLADVALAKANGGPLPEPIGAYARVIGANGTWNTTIECIEDKLHIPLHWRKTRMIFVCSMSDLFHGSVPFDFIDDVLAIINKCPQHTFQILTKRSERMKEYFLGRHSQTMLPLENLWLGVTAENQEMADKRIPILLQIPAAKRFVSIEPMLETIVLFEEWLWSKPYLESSKLLDWIIVGCESGHNRRPCKIEWVRDLVQQCKTTGTPIFVKQLNINGKVIKDINQFPKDLRVREYPKG